MKTINSFLKKIRKRTLIILLVIAGVLVILRIYLPQIVLRYVNTKLSEMENYYGHVKDIDIWLIRGAYVIDDIVIKKKLPAKNKALDTIPFFKADELDLSVQWKAIFEGKLVGEIYVEKPELKFVKGAHQDEDLRSDTSDFRQLVRDLMPLTVNHFQINKGQIHYVDPFSSPPVDISVHSIQAMAKNLSNHSDSADLLPASLVAEGGGYGGNFRLRVDFDALAGSPTFDLDAEVKHADLTGMNDFMQAYGNFDVERGEFNMYAEFAAKNDSFGGYVKPLIKDLSIVKWNKEEGSIPQIIWETIVAAGAKLLTNIKEDQIGTKVYIANTFDDPQINTWGAVSYVLRNAFLQALRPSIEHTVNIMKLQNERKTFFEKIFSPGKKKNKKTKDKKEKSSNLHT